MADKTGFFYVNWEDQRVLPLTMAYGTPAAVTDRCTHSVSLTDPCADCDLVVNALVRARSAV